MEVWVLVESRLVGRDGRLVGDSYVPWLALHNLQGRYPNLHLRLSPQRLEAFLVLDDQDVLEGDLVWQTSSPLGGVPTTARRDPALAARLVREVQTAWPEAEPFSFGR